MNITDSKAPWLIAAVIATLLVGAALGYVFSRRTESPAQAHTSARQAEGKVLYWHDPMVPGADSTSRANRRSWICSSCPSMRTSRAMAACASIPMSCRTWASVLERSSEDGVRRGLEAVGSVAFDERLLEVVQARVAGYVTRLHVKAPLDAGRRGQALLEILAPEWLGAQQDYLALLDAQSPSAQSIRDAARQRLVVLGVPEATIVAIETDAQAARDHDDVRADRRRHHASWPCAKARRSSQAIRCCASTDSDRVGQCADPGSAGVARVAKARMSSARATAWPGETFKAASSRCCPTSIRKRARLQFASRSTTRPTSSSPGMFVSLAFSAAGTAAPQLVVPSEAVIATGERSVVIVSARGRRLRRRQGRGRAVRQDGYTTILSGLEEGQSIALSGQFLIDSEASLDRPSIG